MWFRRRPHHSSRTQRERRRVADNRHIMASAHGGRRMRRISLLRAGVAVAVLYLAVAALVPQPPHGRVLFDGLTPQPPYRWVRPPAGRAGDNEPPRPYATVLPLTPAGSVPAEFATDDLQATLTLPASVVAPRAGETKARVTLTPLDPAALAPPPDGRHFDGNAYRLEAVYDSSGAPVHLTGPITVVLRYAVHAATILRLDRADDKPAWVKVPTTVFTGSQEDLAHSDRLGTFVTSNP
jgi:hypothetical protein